jgi:flagellar basal-body rod protein FlgC
MSGLPIFDIAGSGMAAQTVRLNTVASNLANTDSVTGDPNTAYRARESVFSAVVDQGNPGLAGVNAGQITESTLPALKRFEPGNPVADSQGYVYAPNIDPVAQMVNMISSARAYQADVEVINTAKELALSTLSLGK